jgi:hypothetical protein
VLGAVSQNVTDHGSVRESEDIVEVLQRVLRIAAGVGAAEYGHRALRAKQVAQRIGELRRLCEGADEDEVYVVR